MKYYAVVLFFHSIVDVFGKRPKMEEALEVHKCLRIAAGMFMYIKVIICFHIICIKRL